MSSYLRGDQRQHPAHRRVEVADVGLRGDLGGRRPGRARVAERDRVQVARCRTARRRRARAARPGISAAASSISARTGVMPRVPMISALVISAPSQCERSMTSWPGDAREEVLVAAGEADDLVREHRADDQRDVVLDDGAVEPHVDARRQQPVGQLGDPARRRSCRATTNVVRVPPLVVEHRQPGIARGQLAGRVAEVRGQRAPRSSRRGCRARRARSAGVTRARAARRGRRRAAAAAGSCGCRRGRGRRRCARRGRAAPAARATKRA